MKLAISNIAWENEQESIYALMQQFGFSGLEIAPTKFCSDPYDCLEIAARLKDELRIRYKLSIVSMQSLLFGTCGLTLFEDEERRENLKNYLKKAIMYAKAVECPVLVFGNPRNRVSLTKQDYIIAIPFFKELGEFAVQHQTCLCIEPNPKEYGTNFIVNALQANQLVNDVNSTGFKMIIDTSTMLINQDSLSQIDQVIKNIRHIHISLPYLEPLNRGYSKYKPWLEGFISKVENNHYQGFLSIEMIQANEQDIFQSLKILNKLVK